MESYDLVVSPPQIKDRPMQNVLLCGAGPTDLWPSTHEALTKPITLRKVKVLDDIRAGLQYVFQTKSPLVLAMSGSGHAGLEAAISNLVGPGDTLLIASRGVWDERANEIAKRYGVQTVVHKKILGQVFTLEELEPLLKQHRPTALFITHGDSSTGSVQHLPGLGELCHKYNSLLIVDAVVSLAGVPFLMDKWGVDAVFSGLQKAMSGPAGIAPIAFSARAEENIQSRRHLPPFYFDVKVLANNWNCYGDTRGYHHTLSPPLLWALQCCVKEISRETLPVLWSRHDTVVRYFNKLLEKLTLKFVVPKPEDRLPTVSLIVLPESYNQMDVIDHLRNKYNIVVFPGRAPTAHLQSLRIGLMGVNAKMENAEKVAAALENALKVLKKVFPGRTPTAHLQSLRIGLMGVNAKMENAEKVAAALENALKVLKK